MAYLRNAWYAAAWSSDLGSALLARTFLDEPVLLYRDDAGAPVALADRCPHRFAPLHRGRRLGSAIECGYHGLRFAADGRCIGGMLEHQKIPKNVAVHAYPLAEQHGLIWIWMGAAPNADPATIPDFPFLVNSAAYTSAKGNYLAIEANYLLVCDNLMDLTHAPFLHAGTLANDGYAKAEHEVTAAGDEVISSLVVADTVAPPGIERYLRSGEKHVDQWLDMRWNPGCALMLRISVAYAGRARDSGEHVCATHILTPETETSTHYFYGASRTFARDDAGETEANRERQRHAFEDEDEPMIEAVQQRMGGTELLSMGAVMLSTDAASIKVRRTIDRLIEAERAADQTSRTYS